MRQKNEAIRTENEINTFYFERSKRKSFLKSILKLTEGINKQVDEADFIDSSMPLKESFAQTFSVN